MWVNQKDYNYINVEFAALSLSPENIAQPNYVTGFKFGIVSGKIQIDFWLCFNTATSNIILNSKINCN